MILVAQQGVARISDLEDCVAGIAVRTRLGSGGHGAARIAGARMVVIIGCAGGECRARQEQRPSRVWLGLGNTIPLGRADMSFIVAGSVLLLALFAGIVLDGSASGEGKKRHATFHGW
jgi:hypothetical protein